jgi:transcriptional regulator with XRE-family HTH domain
MKLKCYREKLKKTLEECASELKTSPQNFSRWERGRIPSKEQMLIIVEWSNGEVTPNDFYNQNAA